MKIVPIVSDDPRVARTVSILDGLTRSESNAVIFRDTPEIWFQLYLGLYLELPTFVLIQEPDITPLIQQTLANLRVHVTQVPQFDDAAMALFTKTLEKWVKR